MRKISLLLKLQLSAQLGFGVIRSSKDEKQRSTAKRNIIIYAVLIVLFLLMSVIYSGAMAFSLAPQGKTSALLTMMATATSIVVLISSIARVRSTVFVFGDFDMVMSLPASKGAVAASRLISFYIMDLLFTLVIMLPAGVIYGLIENATAGYYLLMLVFILLLPLAPLCIGGLIGIGLNVALAGFKYKNIVNTFFQLLLVAGWLILNLSSKDTVAQLSQMALNIDKSMASIYPLAPAFTSALTGGSLIGAIVFVGGSLLAAAVFSWITISGFRAIFTAMSLSYRNRNFKLTGQRRSGKLKALFLNEWRRYSGCSVYFINTALGPIACALGSVYLLIFGDAHLGSVFTQIGLQGGMLLGVTSLAVNFIMCLASPTSASISIEGKTMWLSKSLPVDARDWLASKLLTALILPVPGLILLCLVGGFRLFGSVVIGLQLLSLALPPLYFCTVMGLCINLKSYKLNWKSEQEVVKQGMPVLAGMGVCLGSILLVSLPVLVTGMYSVGLAVSGALLVAAILTNASIFRRAEALRRGIIA